MDLTIEQQRTIITQFVDTLPNARIEHKHTQYTHMVIQCIDAVTCNLLIEMLSKQGMRSHVRKGKQTNHYYVQVITRDRTGELMAVCSAINARTPNYDEDYADLERRWSQPDYGITWH